MLPRQISDILTSGTSDRLVRIRQEGESSDSKELEQLYLVYINELLTLGGTVTCKVTVTS